MHVFNIQHGQRDRDTGLSATQVTQTLSEEALPLVSIIVPVFNAAAFLAESIESILAQDYPRVEVIAVDDGSTDTSAAILQSFGDRIRVLRQRNCGPAAARNLGLTVAAGSLIAFHDADDVWLPGKLWAQVNCLVERQDIGLVFGQFAYWRSDSNGAYPDPRWFVSHPETWEIRDRLSGWIYSDEIRDSQIAMITPLIRRSVMSSVGDFDETLASGSDYDYWLRTTYTTQCHKLDQCLALYRLHGDSVTRRIRPTNFGYEIVKRALERNGLVGPGGRSIPREIFDRRLSALALDFAELHLVRGSWRVALSNIGLYFSHTGVTPGSFWRCLSRSVRALAKRARQPIRNRSGESVGEA